MDGMIRAQQVSPRMHRDHEVLSGFADAVRELERELRAELGPADVAHLERVRRWRDRSRVVGRALAALGFDPLTFGLGVVLLAVSKMLSVGPLGHDVYHGAWDRVPGAERYRSKGWQWDAPIDPDIWRAMHNHRHHAHTGRAERDADAHFVFVRINPHVAPDALTPVQPLIGLVAPLAFTHLAHMQYMGVFDTFAAKVLGRPRVHAEVLTTREALGRWWASVRRYVVAHYVVGPLCWGPFAPKVVLGELLAGRLRDLALFYFGFMTHAGTDSVWHPEDHTAASRGAWLRDQVEVSYNTRLPRALSLVLDAVDHHIEHHVFPRIPSHKYRDAAPRLQAICAAHGVRYRTEPLWRRVVATFGEMWRLRTG